MTAVGQIEKKTQARVVRLLVQRLGYTCLGDWTHRSGNANMDTGILTAWLKRQGHSDPLINRAMHTLLSGTAGDQR